jgi:hypothetical protein
MDCADQTHWLALSHDVILSPELEELELVVVAWDEVVELFLDVLVLSIDTPSSVLAPVITYAIQSLRQIDS